MGVPARRRKPALAGLRFWAARSGLQRPAVALRELQGAGPVLTATLLAYVPELVETDSLQLSVLIGVAPFARDSGRSHRTRHVRGGRAIVRRVL
ncbi:MAG: transposase [Opitutaceae bacterium]|nr:transposase [Opitutaceae bacterium]